jgi:predicted ATP-grasp superfamily ATP-dependent carboligase
VTPTNSPKNSRLRRTPAGASVLIAAISGRALARAALDAGLQPLVADFFADTDTQEIATACRKLPGDIADGFQWRSLKAALQALAKQAPSPLLGVVTGSGFEIRPELLTRIEEHWPLLGNDGATVSSIKAPESFFVTLDRLAIPHPVTVMERPAKVAGWLAKGRGGAGGSHVMPSRHQENAPHVYFQEFVEGRTISVLFLANTRKSRVLGFSEQWTAPAPRRQWRYGGAAQPARLTKTVAAEMAEAVAAATEAFGIKGLTSADFVLAGNRPYLLEINPRPGATLDIFADPSKPLLGLHLDAVLDGKLPRRSPPLEGAAASAIVYAPKGIVVPRDMIWPAWAADCPKPGEQIDKHRPLCTVLARAGTRGHARRLVETRKASLLAKIQDLSKGEYRERQEQGEHRHTAKRQHAGRPAHPHPYR